MTDTDALLTDFVYGFWGYGSLDAPWWFVGMEEGGQPNWEEFTAFLHDWHRRGAPAMRDLRPPATERGDSRWFRDRPAIQPYWAKLICTRLAADGRPVDTEAVRAYQRDHLAASDGDTCLLELLPLPAQSTARWPYGEHSTLDMLADRDTYRTRLAPRRATRLAGLIAKHRPAHVVFLGAGYRHYWRIVAGRDVPAHPEPPLITDSGTRMIVARHPTARGVTNAEFEQLGRTLAGV